MSSLLKTVADPFFCLLDGTTAAIVADIGQRTPAGRMASFLFEATNNIVDYAVEDNIKTGNYGTKRNNE